MKTEMTLPSQAAPPRPRLTAAIESLLRSIGNGAVPTAGQPLAEVPRRLLIVKVHGMGDSVLIRLIIEQLRRRNPQMDIGVLSGPATREILTLGTGFRAHSYSQKELTAWYAFKVLREIRSVRYDAVLNFEQGSIAGTAFIACTGIPIHVGFIPFESDPKSMFVTHAVRFDESHSMWQSFVALARIVDPELGDAAAVLDLKSQPETLEWVEGWWQKRIGNSEPAVALHLGCGPSMDYRRWPLDRFVALAGRISLKTAGAAIVLTGTAIERPLISHFMSAYTGRAVDASDAGSLERTASILKRCGLLVSVDTGVMHLGAALGVPTVGLFGPNTPRHWAPIGPHATYVYDTSVVCSPCVNNYQNLIPSYCVNPDRGRCMRDISVESVMKAARRVVIGSWLGPI